MEKKIVFVKLITGEELIATHVGINQETFTYEKTIQLIVRPPESPNGKPTLGFMPFLQYTTAGDKVHINRGSVQLMSEPMPALIAEYHRLTGSIIAPPPTGLII